jgi:hypothetical protein
MKRVTKKLFVDERKERNALEAARKGKKRWTVRYAYMDGVDFQHELGGCSTTMFVTPESLIKDQPCVEECGVFRVKVTLDKEVLPQNFTSKGSISAAEIDARGPKFQRTQRGHIKHAEQHIVRLEQRIKSLRGLIAKLKSELGE